MGDGKQQVSDAVVQAIKDSVSTGKVEVDGVTYLERQVYDPPPPRTVETLNIATLTGLVEFVKTQIGNIGGEPNEMIVQVEGTNAVAVKGPISDDRAKQRDVFARATAQNPFAKGFRLGAYMALSDFNIALRCLFDSGGDRDAIIALLGNVTGTQVAEGQDDGFSQKVTVRRGVVKVGEEEVKNPVSLQPYRTFQEIWQPTSEFILRLKGDPDNEEPPTVALFDADGGGWESDAIGDVVKYLKEGNYIFDSLLSFFFAFLAFFRLRGFFCLAFGR